VLTSQNELWHIWNSLGLNRTQLRYGHPQEGCGCDNKDTCSQRTLDVWNFH